MEADKQDKELSIEEPKLTFKSAVAGFFTYIKILARKFVVGTFMGFAITPFFELFLWFMRTKPWKK
jgi:hypothetical protein